MPCRMKAPFSLAASIAPTFGPSAKITSAPWAMIAETTSFAFTSSEKEPTSPTRTWISGSTVCAPALKAWYPALIPGRYIPAS